MSLALPSPLPPDEERAQTLEEVWWTEIALATVFIGLRYWTRLSSQRKLLLDDIVMGLAWLCFLGDGITIQIIGQTGGTRHFFHLTPSQQQDQTKLILITLFIGIPCTGLGKLAIGITILKIVGNTSKWQNYSVYFTMAMTAATVLIDMSLVMFRCGDPAQLWDFARLAAATASGKCLDPEKTNHFNLFSSAWQVFADFFFSLLPMAIVWGLKLPLRKRLYLICALGLTLFTGAAGIVKTVLTSAVEPTDPTWTVFDVYIWFGTEAMLIIVCGSVPALHPLWERVFNRAGWRSRKEMYGSSGGYGKSSRFKGSSSYGTGGSSKGTMRSAGRGGQSQRIQADDDSTKNLNVMVVGESDVELSKIEGHSVPRPSAAVFAGRSGVGQGSSESWYHSNSTTGDEERGLGGIRVKREIIVSGPSRAR